MSAKSSPADRRDTASPNSGGELGLPGLGGCSGTASTHDVTAFPNFVHKVSELLRRASTFAPRRA